MTYPTIERKEQERIDKKNRELKETELYIDCASFEEFELKRSIAGISYKFFLDDSFKIYYVMRDKLRLIYTNEDGVCILTGLIGMSALMLAIATQCLLLLVITGIAGLVIATYMKMMNSCNYVKEMIRNVNDMRKLKNNKSTTSFSNIPINSLSSCSLSC